MIELTSRICRQFNPATGSALKANTFQYPAWLGEFRHAGFGRIELFGFDTALSYTHESWVERVKASASIGPVLPQADVERFGEVFLRELRTNHPAEPIAVEHFVFCVVARRN